MAKMKKLAKLTQTPCTTSINEQQSLLYITTTTAIMIALALALHFMLTVQVDPILISSLYAIDTSAAITAVGTQHQYVTVSQYSI